MQDIFKKTEQLSPRQIERAAALLRRDELVAFPTETVYGLGGRYFSPEALRKIYEVKGRPQNNPLTALLGDLDQLQLLGVEIPPEGERLIEAYFPGPLTLVLKRIEGGTVGVRISSHPIAQELLRLVGEPLAAPSANLSGKPSSTSPAHILEDFEGKIAALIDGGESSLGIESTVICLSTFTLLRPGALSQEEIEKVAGRPFAAAPQPDSKYRPKAKVKLFFTEEELLRHLSLSSPPRLLLANAPFQGAHPLSAQTLYASFRLADKMKAEEIAVLCDKEVQSNSLLMNRLTLSSDKGAGVFGNCIQELR